MSIVRLSLTNNITIKQCKIELMIKTVRQPSKWWTLKLRSLERTHGFTLFSLHGTEGVTLVFLKLSFHVFLKLQIKSTFLIGLF